MYWLAIDYEWFTLLQSKLNIQVIKNVFFFYQILTWSPWWRRPVLSCRVAWWQGPGCVSDIIGSF